MRTGPMLCAPGTPDSKLSSHYWTALMKKWFVFFFYLKQDLKNSNSSPPSHLYFVSVEHISKMNRKHGSGDIYFTILFNNDYYIEEAMNPWQDKGQQQLFLYFLVLVDMNSAVQFTEYYWFLKYVRFYCFLGRQTEIRAKGQNTFFLVSGTL